MALTSEPSQAPPVSSPSSPTNSVRVKHPELWLNDGNIIIRAVSQPKDAPSAPPQMLFRVHRSVLALHSPVFSGLFGIDQGSFESASEKFEGIPVMELPDPAEQLESLLKALYFPRFVFGAESYRYLRELQEPIEIHRIPDEIAGALLLAAKYEIASLQKISKDALTKAWPASLQDWDKKVAMINEHDFVPPDPAQAIRLAMASRAYDSLPAAFYELCLTVWRTDRSLNIAPLHADELRCLLYGQKRLMGRFDPGGDSYLPSLLLRLPPLPCPEGLACLDGTIQWIHGFANEHPGYTNKGFDPLRWITDARADLAAGGPRCCGTCKARMNTVFDEERTQIWNHLGEYFSLNDLQESHQ